MVKYTFCPFCKGKLAYVEDRYECPDCGKKVFVSSFPGLSVLPVKEGKVLLALRGEEPRKGTWDSIGGFLKEGENPEEGIKRETLEETGLNVSITGLLGIYTDSYTYEGQIYETLNLYYLGEIVSGDPDPKDDVSLLKWYPIEKPPTKLGFKSFGQALKDLQKWYLSNKDNI